MTRRAHPRLLVGLLSCLLPIAAAGADSSTVVGDDGVLRWRASGEPLALFGVNYTTPFAHAFRAHQRLGVSLEAAIDADVYHLARLGFDAYRIHVWDREISDPAGNLVVNDHVRAFDHLLARLKERGIKIVLTPLQFGDASYPEPGVALDGFSSKYGKQGSLEDRESWPLQERYLAQFVSHVNPLTGLAYKDDPDVVAFEICNEPGHFEYAPTVEYINRMTAAIRATGCTTPVFYNMSHGIPVADAYLDAQVQGGTFQWYPASLVAGHEQHGNFLPYVDDYAIPFATDPRFLRKAKLVYEFDAADIGRSYIYPAIARTFRTAGMQIAAMFAYDPMAIAAVNTEYQTHYMNLAYAPSKALGLMVAAEAFRRVPLHADYGRFPENTAFADVRVSYRDDLAELVTTEKFLHSNTTTTRPPAPDQLAHIAGFGSSPLVDYPGRGAYFLDRVEPGVWRLEVMPDAIWVRDPYEKPSPAKHVTRIAWNEWPMRISLPDLGAGFASVGVNDGNPFRAQAEGATLRVRPGVTLLTRAGVQTACTGDDRLGNIRVKEFAAPPPSLDKACVLHDAIVEATAGEDLQITAIVVAPYPIGKVELVADVPLPPEPPRVRVRAPGEAPPRIQPGGGNRAGAGQRVAPGIRAMGMTHVRGSDYAVTIPGVELRAGTLRYHIVVHGEKSLTTFPAEVAGRPTEWDFVGEGWTTRMVAPRAPVLLFDPAVDAPLVTANHREARYPLVSSDRPGVSALRVAVDDLLEREHDHSFRFFFRPKVRARMADLVRTSRLVLFGRSATDRPCVVQIALMTADGVAYGAMVTLTPEHKMFSVPVAALRQVRSPNIPHGYPVYIPFWSEVERAIPLELKNVESVLVSIGPGIPVGDRERPHGVEIERIWME